MLTKKTEFSFKLSKTLEYMKEGQKGLCKELVMKAPSVNNMRLISKLKQDFFRAVKSLQNDFRNIDTKAKANEEDSGDMDSDQIISILYMSDIDMGEYIEVFKELMMNGLCYLDSTQKMTEALYDNLDCDDLENLLGKYLENFMMSSWLNMTRKK